MLVVVTGAIGLEASADSVDAGTIVLLFSMMVIVAHLRFAGALDLLVHLASRHIAHPAALLGVVVFAAGVLSALFVNDTVCLVCTPLVLDLTEARRLRPHPYLLALTTASNIGSTATLTGNPQNILIGNLSGLSFGAFASALAPVALVGLVLDLLLLCVLFRRDLWGPRHLPASARAVRTDRLLLWKTALVGAGVLAGFLAGYRTAVVAAAGAAALLVTRRVQPRKVYRAVDWDLLLLFVGLFVVVAAGRRAGIDTMLLAWLAPLGVTTIAGLSATAAVLSNVVSNVPAVMLFTSIVPMLPDPDTAWLALAMSSTLAGNLTVLGSIANLIVIEGARRRGVRIGFFEYALVGVPLTLATLACGVWWLA